MKKCVIKYFNGLFENGCLNYPLKCFHYTGCIEQFVISISNVIADIKREPESFVLEWQSGFPSKSHLLNCDWRKLIQFCQD